MGFPVGRPPAHRWNVHEVDSDPGREWAVVRLAEVGRAEADPHSAGGLAWDRLRVLDPSHHKIAAADRKEARRTVSAKATARNSWGHGCANWI